MSNKVHLQSFKTSQSLERRFNRRDFVFLNFSVKKKSRRLHFVSISTHIPLKGKYYENDFDAVKKLLSSFTDTNLYVVNWRSLFLLMMFTHRASKGRLAETILIDS